MIETISLQKDRRLLAWRPELDFKRWNVLLERVGGVAAQAFSIFTAEIQEQLTPFIGELRSQLLRPYSYELPEMERMIAERTGEIKDLDHTCQRAAAIELGMATVRDYFLTHGEEAQVILMSPVSEAAGDPEFEHTALYWQTYRNGKVEAWQLFVDFSSEERKAYMAWVARRAGIPYHAKTDLEFAARPVLSESSAKPLYNSLFEFVADIAQFRKNTRGRASISGISLDDPAGFIKNQLRLETKNRREAEGWIEPYIRAIAQGSLDLARRVITKLQLKALNLTESAVRAAARLTSVDSSALHVFLRACGFLSFSFSPETSMISPQSFFAVPTLGGHCQEKICNRCGAHAGDHDTTCPSCGWSP